MAQVSNLDAECSEPVKYCIPHSQAAPRLCPDRVSSTSMSPHPVVGGNSALQHSPDDITSTGSTYALQVALRNMKERYQKLQRKMANIEEENQQLVHGKTELFGEIGTMQEASIKLREKNLQLNQEIHSKHQENCSLQEMFARLSQENMTLSRRLAHQGQDVRRWEKQVGQLMEENKSLKSKLRIHAPPTAWAEAHTPVDDIQKDSLSVDSAGSRQDGVSHSPRRPTESHRAKPSSPSIPQDSLQPPDSETDNSSTSSLEEALQSLSTNNLLQSVDTATEQLQAVASALYQHNSSLLNLLPVLQATVDTQICTDSAASSTLGQRDAERPSVTVPISSRSRPLDEDDELYNSCLATCGSTVAAGMLLSNVHTNKAAHTHLPSVNNSGGDNNVLVEASTSPACPHSPFDWRQVHISDEEVEPQTLTRYRTEMKSVGTSPDLTHGDGDWCYTGKDWRDADSARTEGGQPEEEDERTCPMCHQIFSSVVPQDTFEAHVISHFENESFEFIEQQ